MINADSTRAMAAVHATPAAAEGRTATAVTPLQRALQGEEEEDLIEGVLDEMQALIAASERKAEEAHGIKAELEVIKKEHEVLKAEREQLLAAIQRAQKTAAASIMQDLNSLDRVAQLRKDSELLAQSQLANAQLRAQVAQLEAALGLAQAKAKQLASDRAVDARRKAALEAKVAELDGARVAMEAELQRAKDARLQSAEVRQGGVELWKSKVMKLRADKARLEAENAQLQATLDACRK